MPFRDRRDAGRRLAVLLERYRDQDPLVLGLPRGGVVVAAEVAYALDAPLDVWVVRKIGAPDQPELALGALSEGGAQYLNQELMQSGGVSRRDLGPTIDRERAELERRVRLFRGPGSRPDVRGGTVIVVDDGLATGATARAALRDLRALGAARVVLAAPVAAPDTVKSLRHEADEIVCLEIPPAFGAVGAFYVDFEPTTDEEVLGLLRRSREEVLAAPRASRA
jgi:putative phosphoribosyl transferase